MALLEVSGLDVHYGAIHALRGVSLRVDEGEIVTLVGSNGAGKSTTLRAISGLVPPSAGTIHYGGRPLQGKPPHEIVAMGVAQAPEGRGIFANLTVEENLKVGAYARREGWRELEEERASALAHFPQIRERLGQRAGTLSGGEQQMLAIARALGPGRRVLTLSPPGRAPC